MPGKAGLRSTIASPPRRRLADAGERFDIVLAMEVVEHVADVKLFVARCAEMVQPGGLMIVATINRTLKSFALAIVGAEYVLRWLPRGTHQWDKFVTPDELEIAMERAGLRTTDERGVIYNLLADRWELSTDTDVNYMVLAEAAMPLSTRRAHASRRDYRADRPAGWLSCHGSEACHDHPLLALGRIHAARRGRADRAQRDAARADREPRHGRRDACALPVRLSVRARCSSPAWCSSPALALPRPGPVLRALAAGRRAGADRRDRADARRDGPALLRGDGRLHQDRAGAGRDLRASVPRRHRQRCR